MMPKDILADLADPILTMMNVRVGRRVSRTQQVENRLKCALILGLMKPGERINTKDVAEELRMSITPVREALVRLASQEALSITPSHAFTVPEITKERLLEYMSLRKLIETEAVKKAVRNLDDSRLNEFLTISDALRLSHQSENRYETVKLHLAMRLKLYTFCESPALCKLIIQLWIIVGPSFNFLFDANIAGLSEWPDYYHALNIALKNRDEDKAVEAIQLSLDRGSEIYLKHISRT